MAGSMENDWKEEIWTSARDRIAYTYERASSFDVEVFLKFYIMGPCSTMLQYIMTMVHNIMHMLNHATQNYKVRVKAMDMLNHARRNYDFRGSSKNIKLGQFLTRLRMGRLGYLLLLFAALSTLAVPMMFQNILPQQVDQEFERAMNIRDHIERAESVNREASFSEERNLVSEEGDDSLEIPENKPQVIIGLSNEKETVEANVLPSKEESTTELTSELVKLPDPAQSWSKSVQLERELSENQHFASTKESDLISSKDKTDGHQRATRPKNSRPKRPKFKRLAITEDTFKHADEAKKDRGSGDPRTIDSSAEQASSYVASTGANSTVDVVGSPNGFTEAYEEVLKLASEANKTTGEKSAQLQEEPSMTELLPIDKLADLHVQSLEVTDVNDQKLSRNDSSVNKDSMASLELDSEEQEYKLSVGGEGDALPEATYNATESNSSLSGEEDSATEISILEPHEENDNPQNDTLLHTKEHFTTDELETVAGSKVSDAAKTTADVKGVSSSLHQDVVGNFNESTIASLEVSDSDSRLAEKDGEAGNNLEASSDLSGGSTVNVPETTSNFTSVKDGADVKFANVTVDEKPDNGFLKDQRLQAEVQQENGNQQPQESELISSLKSRAASGLLQVGLLNMVAADLQNWRFLAGEGPMIIPFEGVKETVKWEHLYPEWIDEEQRYGTPNCPSVPMPMVSPEVRLDVVIAYAPCTPSTLQDGWKNPTSLQVLLGAANLAVKTGNESAYVLILSKCRPLVNLFTCEELLEHRDQGWLYLVNSEQLRKRISLPVGSCQLSVPLQGQDTLSEMEALNSQKDAYATILHSGADYVCGAIATARSIRKTGSTKDLVILVDSSISPEHRQALQEAGWKVRDLERIFKSLTVGEIQNEKDFSRFRLWQLTEYSKVIYVEADVLLLQNLDHLFRLPEISGSGSTSTLFNSGLMVIEPSNCTFQYLMDEMEKSVLQVGGEWDFFNRIFPWWHRIPRHMNYLKYFWTRKNNEGDYMNKLFSADPPRLYAIHYWGFKPWQCFRDYDCNWNINQHFASDEAHAQWFKVYDDMPWSLQKHCGLSTGTKAYLELNRRKAEAAAFSDKHWAVTITDPRLNVCQENHCDWNALLSHWDKTANTTNASTR